MIEVHSWTGLKHLVPPELRHLCNLCEEFEEFVTHLERTSPSLTGYDVKKVNILSSRIMSEYIKTLKRNKIISEEDLKQISDEITLSMSAFFDVKGFPKTDLANIFTSQMRSGNLEFYLPVFLQTIMAFIHSKIYDSLIEAYTISQKYFYNHFVETSIGRIGTMKRIEEEEKKLVMEKDND